MELDLRGIIPDFGQIGPATTPADIDVSSSSFLEGFHVNAALEDNEGTLIGMNDMDYLFSFHDRLPDQLNHSEQPFFMDVSYNLTPLPSPMPPKPCFFYPQLHSRAQPEQLTALESMNLLKPSASASNLNGVLLSCSCVSTALTLLEELAVDGHDTGTQSTSQRLGFKRRCLLTCATLLGCSECSKIPRFLMLLIQICQKAVDSYVVLAKILQEGKSLHGHLTGLSYPESFQQVPVSKTAPYPMYNAQDVSPTHGAGPSMSLGEYDVTSEEEMCVFTSLATMQLAKWKGFLGQLSERCASLGLKSHMAMGVQLERRVQMQMHELSLSG
ncbi:hypothetical protein BU16DRAFT_563924 [Lophium mytilinum]|uniref:Aflatoxin regulatory protein domain-containing protein n=1 Tax=Lophium mytilinum TaxID=390894 RepID=A0A6A6QLL7_9PEZI|nr:hypothetical protein BU16DRAFT_563924 [Lophium mytilinum]